MKKIISALLSVALASSAFAADNDTTTSGDWYISPLGSLIISDESRGTEEDGYNFRLGLGKEVSDSFNLELGMDLNRFDREDTTRLEQVGLKLDALYFFNRENTISPYIATGIGIFNTSETDDTNPIWSAGLGLMTNIGVLDNAKFRTEVRFQQEYDSGDYVHDDVLLRAGVQIPFGASAPAPTPKPMPKDSDGDGVYDDADKCPATPAGVKVNSYGCEVKAPVVLDSDNDGVYDNADKCPNTPAGTAVNSFGCALDPDDDNDGVPNSKDQCPNSAAGVKIDFKGCEIKAVITLPGINFETNSAKLTASSLAILDGAAETLNKYSSISALVAGHTDSTGADSYNMSLSERRAASVLNYLVSKGVSASRLSSNGFGETQPIADNKTKDSRAMNRRVNLRVQD